MKTSGYLVINDRGSMRVTKNPPSLEPNEISAHLNLDIPNQFFQRPRLAITIGIPNDVIANVPADVAVEITAEAVAGALRIDVDDVRDGLTDLLDNRKASA